MIPLQDLLVFSLAAFIMVLSPGPNMIYLISKSMTEGKSAGVVSLFGISCGFIFHILMVSFGLTAIFATVPLAFTVVKVLGICYLLYLAYQSARSKTNMFNPEKAASPKANGQLFLNGMLTNILNPKMAIFYLSFFPQFIHPENGEIFSQSLQLGVIQVLISFTINLLIVLGAVKLSGWFAKKPVWMKIQKWFMASVLTGLAIKMAFAKAK